MKNFREFQIIPNKFLPEQGRWNILKGRWYSYEDDKKDTDYEKETEDREYMVIDTARKIITANPIVIRSVLSKLVK